MDNTLLLSRRSSSNCSRMVGVIRALTISERFSLRIGKRSPTGKGETGRGETQRFRGGVALVAGAFIAGCVSVPKDAGKYFSIEHGQMMFSTAYSAAKRHCEELGMDTRHLGTDHVGLQSVSRFECVAR